MKSFYASRKKNVDYLDSLKSDYIYLRVLLANNEVEKLKVPQLDIDIFSSIAGGDQVLFSQMVDQYLMDYYQCTDCIKDWVAAASDNESKANIIDKKDYYVPDFDYI